MAECPSNRPSLMDLEGTEDITVTKDNGTIYVDTDSNITVEKIVTDLLIKNKNVDQKDLQNSSQPMITRVLRIRDYKKDAAVCKELNEKLKQMVKENSSNSEEMTQLLHKVTDCIEREKKRKTAREEITLNRRCSVLRKTWANRDLPVDKESLQSVANKDVFDMTTLNESLPLKLGNNDIDSKAENLTKKFLSLVDQRRRAYRKSEIARMLTSNTGESNNNPPSSSSKVSQPLSLTSIVKKVCGDVKNVRIFSFRRLIKAENDSNSNIDSKRVSCPDLRELPVCLKEESQNLDGKKEPQNLPYQSKPTSYMWDDETIVFLNSQCVKTEETSDKQKKEDGPNSKAENKFQDTNCSQFIRNQCHHEKHNVAVQQLHDSISLGRQMSRLKITNSRRGDLSECMDESEIKNISLDENKDEQAKTGTTEDRKTADKQRVVERLRIYQNQMALKKHC